MKIFLIAIGCLPVFVFGQSKKPLSHAVYDNWKSPGERGLSNNGRFVYYAVNPQEGDGTLFLREFGTGRTKAVDRAYNAEITQDSKYAVFRIKPKFQDTRQARIKKKKPDEMPKDSLGIYFFDGDSLLKFSRVKSFKVPEKAGGWLAWHSEKELPDTLRKRPVPDSIRLKIDRLTKLADSIIRKSLDSVKGNVEREELIKATNKAVKEIYKRADEEDAEGDEPAAAGGRAEGTTLTLRNLNSGAERKFLNVTEYGWSKTGNFLWIETAKGKGKDSTNNASVLLFNTSANKADTIMRGLNDAGSYAFSEDGTQLAFVAERDSVTKALQKFYRLWYYKAGADSARIAADRNSSSMLKGFTVSENADVRFSKDGRKLFFGTVLIAAPKDTNLVEFETAKLDVWHYNDDFIQPYQLKQLPNELKRSFVAVVSPGSDRIVQLGTDSSENISLVNEGNADWVLAQTTKGNRIRSQWEGRALTTAWVISTVDGSRKLIMRNALGNYNASPAGIYVSWYDPKAQNYFTYNVATGRITNVSEKIKVPLFRTDDDVPDFPSQAGTTGWLKDDQYFFVNDEYDIWQTDPAGVELPINITAGAGLKGKIDFTYRRTDPDKRFFEQGETVLLDGLDKTTKSAGIYTLKIGSAAAPMPRILGAFSFSGITKAKDADRWLWVRSNSAATEFFTTTDLASAEQLTYINEQQKEYNWLSAELMRWKMFDGKMSEGILYKPENFDPKKKYPVIFYFYERNSDLLNTYKAPQPSASTINIPWFVSNGYIVFDPNIYYKTGEPGASAYNSVVSAAKYLSKMPWIDSTRMAIQGQSWGGYQVAYLVTRTNIFRAAGAGAPVSNMTSAYGGIRWGTGINRQFQYEKSQSRIGATLWEKPELYIKNSPLFAADKIETPLLLMHNDADGAVPWYQSIELFSAMKRLNKKVWLLQYNNEDHNLVERRNRKDLSVRLSQFFDHYLKDARPADWIKNGLPATKKGISWGLEIEEPIPEGIK